MATFSFRKDPEAVLDYAFDWSPWLQEGEAIVSHTIVVSGATLESSAEAGGLVTAWLSGGDAGRYASVECEVTTNLGRTDQRTLSLRMAHR